MSFHNVNANRNVGFDGTNQGAVDFEVQPGTFQPLQLRVRLTGVAVLISTPIISLGTNSPNYDNLLSNTPLTSLASINGVMGLPIVSSVVNYGDAVKLNIVTPAVASTFDFEAILTHIWV